MKPARTLALATSLGAVALLTGCAASTPVPVTPAAPLTLTMPAQLDGKATLLSPLDADYARADPTGAVKPAGEGNLEAALVVKLTADLPVWRLWSGPDKKDARGNTNRIGQWWSYDAPHGSRRDYRAAYEICTPWNDLYWVARCTLKSGAVVAVGPGNSVSAQTCGDPAGQEAYPANERDWQLYVAKAWTRLGADKELDCPDPSQDYLADPTDISRPAATN